MGLLSLYMSINDCHHLSLTPWLVKVDLINTTMPGKVYQRFCSFQQLASSIIIIFHIIIFFWGNSWKKGTKWDLMRGGRVSWIKEKLVSKKSSQQPERKMLKYFAVKHQCQFYRFWFTYIVVKIPGSIEPWGGGGVIFLILAVFEEIICSVTSRVKWKYSGYGMNRHQKMQI